MFVALPTAVAAPKIAAWRPTAAARATAAAQWVASLLFSNRVGHAGDGNHQRIRAESCRHVLCASGGERRVELFWLDGSAVPATVSLTPQKWSWSARG